MKNIIFWILLELGCVANFSVLHSQFLNANYEQVPKFMSQYIYPRQPMNFSFSHVSVAITNKQNKTYIEGRRSKGQGKMIPGNKSL